MADRSAKLRKLNSFRRKLPHVSARALSSILDEIHQNGVPDMRRREHMLQATALELEEITPYGPLIHDVELHGIDGDVSTVLYINPFALLYKSAMCVGFATVLSNRLEAIPPSPEAPWQIVLYTDEVVPGNQLLAENKRKLWAIYWSFLELGAAALADENAWFIICCIRSMDVKKIAAGISQLMGRLIKVFFGLHVHNFSTGGIVVRLDGKPARIFAKLGMVLQDGGAHKQVWHCKGDAGTKICMLCLNLFAQKSGIVDEDGEDTLTCTLIHESELHFASNTDVRGAVRRLHACKATDAPGMFALREQAVGYKYEPYGLLMDPELDTIVNPVSQFCHDWMHAIFVHGVFGTVVFRLLESMVSDGRRDVWDSLDGYMQLWTWPSRVHSNSMKSVFSQQRATSSRKAKNFKCAASEGLSMYPVLAFFVQTVLLPAGRRIHECKAFIALADMIDLLCAIPLGCVSVDQLRECIKVFLNLCMDAGWSAYMHPKFHWLVHLPKHYSQFMCLPTCWVHERKHSVVKRYANEICNTGAFERSLLGEVISHQLADLDRPDCFVSEGLIRPKPATRKMQAFLNSEFGIREICMVSPQARFSKFETCGKGDVVLYKCHTTGSIMAGQVWFHTVVLGTPITALSVWSRVAWDDVSGAAEWLICKSPEFISTSDIRVTVLHCTCRHGVCRTLVPCMLRMDM